MAHMPNTRPVERKESKYPVSGGDGHGGYPPNAGRGTYLTPEVHEAIVEGLAQGNYISTVMGALGIHKSRFNAWLEKGQPEPVIDEESQEIVGYEYPDNFYGEFARDVAAATARAEVEAVKALKSHFHADWRAAEAFLSRKFPERWNPKHIIEHQGKDGGPIEVSEKREALFAQLDVIDVESDELELESGEENPDESA